MRKLNRGFTIVEVVLVMVIIAIVASMIMPSFQAIQRSQAATGFRQGLESVAQKARTRAIRENRATHILFDSNGSIGWDFIEEAAVDPQTGESTGTETELELGQVRDPVQPTATTSFSTYELNREDVDQTDWQVGFFPDGSADRAYLEFTMDDQTFVLIVNNRSGSTRVVQGTIEDQTDDEWEAGEIERRVG